MRHLWLQRGKTKADSHTYAFSLIFVHTHLVEFIYRVQTDRHIAIATLADWLLSCQEEYIQLVMHYGQNGAGFTYSTVSMYCILFCVSGNKRWIDRLNLEIEIKSIHHRAHIFLPFSMSCLSCYKRKGNSSSSRTLSQ